MQTTNCPTNAKKTTKQTEIHKLNHPYMTQTKPSERKIMVTPNWDFNLKSIPL